MHFARSRAGFVVAAASLALGLTACASGSDAADAVDAAPEAAGSPSAVPVDSTPGAASGVDAGQGDYVFGTGRDTIAQAVESAYATTGGQAAWEGDTLVLGVDGDATEAMAGFSQCRVVTELLNEGDAAAIEFPNGRVECADVLTDD